MRILVRLIECVREAPEKPWSRTILDSAVYDIDGMQSDTLTNVILEQTSRLEPLRVLTYDVQPIGVQA